MIKFSDFMPVDFPVSYTHLTLPTNREVEVVGDPAALKQSTAI